jgi:hypothetical protein
VQGKSLLMAAMVLGSLCALGCEQTTSGQTAFVPHEWATYTSPDQLVSFEYPVGMNLTVRPRLGPDDPHLALSLVSPDETLDVTLLLRLSVDELPDYCQHMIESSLDANTKAMTECEPISLGEGKGLRQEFRSGHGSQAVEFIAVALAAEPAYVAFSCGYLARNKQELRPICERIVNSLKLQNP